MLVALNLQGKLTEILGNSNLNKFRETVKNAMINAINDDVIDESIILHHNEGNDLILCSIELLNMEIMSVNTMNSIKY
ncbi:MAG: hypothetical protein ACK5LC_03590 [Coprobacillaceae bacterium]